MKKLFTLVSLTFVLYAATKAQPPQQKDGAGYASGEIVLPGGAKLTGSIRDNIRKKGEIIILQESKKIRYKAGDISAVQVGGTHYITNNYTFYEILSAGERLSLLRKANQPSGVQYNGTDPIVIAPGEGNVDDLFIRNGNETVLQLLTKKNISEVLGKYCTACISAIDTKTFDGDNVKKAVEDCGKCR